MKHTYYIGNVPKQPSVARTLVTMALWIGLFLFDIACWLVLHYFVKVL